MKIHFIQIGLSLTKLIVFFMLLIHPAFGQGIAPDKEKTFYHKNTYTYKTVGNLDIHADVYRYPGKEVLPVIIWIHGGALVYGSRMALPPSKQFEHYLKAGFALVSIDYRLAPETKLPYIIEDIEDAYSWVYNKGPELFNIDSARISVMGMSAGGYLALVAGHRVNPLPKAVVSLYGFGDVSGAWQARPDPFYNEQPKVPEDEAYLVDRGSEISNTLSLRKDISERRSKFMLYCRQNGLWPRELRGQASKENDIWFSQYEPRHNVTAAYPPTMLLHGEKDTDVPFEQSVLMAKVFKLNNVDYEFIHNPSWGHGFDYTEEKDPAIQKAFVRIQRFLEKYGK